MSHMSGKAKINTAWIVYLEMCNKTRRANNAWMHEWMNVDWLQKGATGMKEVTGMVSKYRKSNYLAFLKA